ncbi:P-loop containing nucleoside triphosphate hydrolase protein [Neoconidiobolus thromboides FSU 785]|nr:P-loop containing nucleoside triphosphate hydrolase protein [Neoconidiobolus thromboides FSU 785]
MTYCKIIEPRFQSTVDYGMICYFKGPNTFTGEDIVEFNLHGSLAVVKKVLKGIEELNGSDSRNEDKFVYRVAENGEFIKRAFFNNKLDLTEVEGLQDLLNSETDAQLKLALKQVSGETKKIYDNIRTQIIDSLATLEAFIDFSEDEEIDSMVLNRAKENGIEVLKQMDYYLNDQRRGEILTSGIKLTILGPPNAGKSSLLNYFVQKELAIVSNIPGTTRDIVSGTINLDGLPLVINDTAGIRDTLDPIEKEGVKRALKIGDNSDINLLVFDGMELLNNNNNKLLNNDKLNLKIPTMILINKSENINEIEKQKIKEYLKEIFNQHEIILNYIFISCKYNQNLNEFLNELSNYLKNKFEDNVLKSSIITNERHRIHLNRAKQELQLFLDIIDIDIVLASEHLKLVAQEIGNITGIITHDQVLDQLFKGFCIGK